jgi:hypothetical protein
MADDLAQRAERQQRGDHGDLVDIDHPDHICWRGMQVGGDGGQRDIGDGGIERGHGKGGKDGKPRPTLLARRQPFRRLGSLCRDTVCHSWGFLGAAELTADPRYLG